MTSATLLKETWCGVTSCPHPACWQAQRRVIRGVPQHIVIPADARPTRPAAPTQKIHNMVSSVFGSDQTGPPNPTTKPGSKGMSLFDYLRTRSRYTSAPATHRPSGSGPSENSDISYNRSKLTGVNTNRNGDQSSRVSNLEVHQFLDFSELDSNWSTEGSASQRQQFYVWRPNPARKTRNTSESTDNSKSITDSPSPQFVPTQDLTNQIAFPKPNEKEPAFSTSQKAIRPAGAMLSQRTARQTRSSKGTSAVSSNGQVIHESNVVLGDGSVVNLMGLPTNILSQVLDHIEQGELFSRDQLSRFLAQCEDQEPTLPISPRPGLDGPVQTKATLHIAKDKNLRNPRRHETRQIFQLDPRHPFISREKTSPNLSTSGPDPSFMDPALPPLHPLSRSLGGAGPSLVYAGPVTPSVQCVSRSATSIFLKPGGSQSNPNRRLGRQPVIDLMLAPVQKSQCWPSSNQSDATPRTDNSDGLHPSSLSSDRLTIGENRGPSGPYPSVSVAPYVSDDTDSEPSIYKGIKAPLSSPQSMRYDADLGDGGSEVIIGRGGELTIVNPHRGETVNTTRNDNRRASEEPQDNGPSTDPDDRGPHIINIPAASAVPNSLTPRVPINAVKTLSSFPQPSVQIVAMTTGVEDMWPSNGGEFFTENDKNTVEKPTKVGLPFPDEDEEDDFESTPLPPPPSPEISRLITPRNHRS